MDGLPEIVNQRSKDSREILLTRLNANNLQNIKKEEVERLINQFKAQVMLLTGAKIGASYPNRQFEINSFQVSGVIFLCTSTIKEVKAPERLQNH